MFKAASSTTPEAAAATSTVVAAVQEPIPDAVRKTRTVIRSNRRNLNVHLDSILDAAGTLDPDAMDALMASLVSAVGYCCALTKRLEAMVEAGTIDGASVTDVFSAS